MHSKKQRTKNRRRARKLADQAWESVDADNLDMAMKLIRRATDVFAGNPILWNDRGLIHMMRDETDQASKSFLAALALTPDFAEAYAHLAGIALQEGKPREAAELIARAAALQPANATYTQLKDAYAAAATRVTESVRETKDETPTWTRNLASRVDRFDWEPIEEELTDRGLAVLPRLLSDDECAFFRDMFEDPLRTAQQVVMDKQHFGRGVYKYLRSPLPEEIVGIRQTLYAKLKVIVNHWMRLLRSDEEFPSTHSEFLERCVTAGQTSPTPLLLKYGRGGFNAAHRDLRGDVFFPLQVAIVLSPEHARDEADDGFRGGEFFLRDGQTNKGSFAGEKQVTLGLGDAVVFCTRERLTPFLDQHAIIPVSHGAKEVTAGTRYVMAVPFHDYVPSG